MEGAPEPIFGAGDQAGFNRIRSDVVHDPFQFSLIAHPMVVGLMLLELAGAFQQPIGQVRRINFSSCV